MEIYGKTYHIKLSFKLMMSLLWLKLKALWLRLQDLFLKLPVRFYRILQHLLKGLKSLFHRSVSGDPKSWWTRILSWWIEMGVLLLDFCGVSEGYETLMDFIKFNTRSMYQWEIDLAKTVFGDSIHYKRVRIDEWSFVGPRQKKFCYVSFYMINSWGPMQNSTLLHELTHIWQFERLGAVYIPRAIKAQFSKMGYDYGGVSTLKAFIKKGKSFLSFNLEQQGDIISDYYRIKDGYHPQWGSGKRHDLPVYESFIKQVRNGIED